MGDESLSLGPEPSEDAAGVPNLIPSSFGLNLLHLFIGTPLRVAMRPQESVFLCLNYKGQNFSLYLFPNLSLTFCCLSSVPALVQFFQFQFFYIKLFAPNKKIALENFFFLAAGSFHKMM